MSCESFSTPEPPGDHIRVSCHRTHACFAVRRDPAPLLPLLRVAKVLGYSVQNVPCTHAARAIEPLLKPTIPSAMHVFEEPCDEIAIRLPMTPSPPTSSSSCCPNLDSSGLDSTRPGRKVIGRVKLSISLHSEAGTVKSPVELVSRVSSQCGFGRHRRGLHCSLTRWSTSSRDGSAGPAPV